MVICSIFGYLSKQMTMTVIEIKPKSNKIPTKPTKIWAKNMEKNETKMTISTFDVHTAHQIDR